MRFAYSTSSRTDCTGSDSVTAREDDTLKAWRVSFTLAEKLSTAERVETRRPGNPIKQQSAPGQAVGDAAPAAGSDSAGAELTGFEKVLKRLDTALE